jgi:putative transposase
MAARNYTLADDAIFHSDRGTQGGFKWSSQHWFVGVNIARCGVLRREFSNRVLCGVAC